MLHSQAATVEIASNAPNIDGALPKRRRLSVTTRPIPNSMWEDNFFQMIRMDLEPTTHLLKDSIRALP